VKKYNLSFFIPKTNLISALSHKGINSSQREPVEAVRQVFLKRHTTKEVYQLALIALKKKYQKNFEIFNSEIGKKIHPEDLLLLTKKNLEFTITEDIGE
jgi:hypothetical protein